MECINPLLTQTSGTIDKIDFSSINKHETLMECDSTISALKKAFSTPPTYTTNLTWNPHSMYKNCNCKRQYTGDVEHCDLNRCTCNLLLQGSDDPLIGHGANSVIDDDHPMELRTLQLQQQQQLPTTTTTTTTINWSDIVKEKLKNKTQAKVNALQKQQQQQHQQQLNDEQNEYQKYNLKMHLKTERNNNNNNISKVKKQQQQQEYREKLAINKPAHENVKSWLKSIVDMQNNVIQQEQQSNKQQQQQSTPILNKKKIETKHSINYNDLPYMGEITLDNSRPRRGRKPKKANICHLIYKNYGTIILGEPKISACNSCKLNQNEPQIELQTQTTTTTKIENLPLNLCLRDQQQQQQQQQQLQQPYKLNKKSTIFIPPPKSYETGSNTNSNTSPSPSVEVSIGKFKFTGGVNPLLQKKKMLSVDSVGNYIYFDGNDNKMLHATAQQQQKLPQQQTNTAETLKYTTFPKCLNKLKESGSSLSCAEPKKKLTRRSEQRERLEKSFKQQGFLIQTQQMQSSEGATYCKFRQLKKFTRYLFRNWKDYLPDELQQQQQQQQQQQPIEDRQKSTHSLTSPNFNKTEHNAQNAK